MVKTAWLGVSNASKKNKEDNIHNIALVKLKNMVYVVAYNYFWKKQIFRVGRKGNILIRSSDSLLLGCHSHTHSLTYR